jgi:hypothetical protein
MDAPIGQVVKWKMAWKRVSEVVEGCQVLGYLLKVCVPSRNTRKAKCMRYMLGGVVVLIHTGL